MTHALIPYEDIQDREDRGTIGITAVTRLKHADLWAAAKKFEHARKGSSGAGHYGGQSAMARKLKMCAAELGKWINLQACPPAEPRGKWTAKRLMRLETALFKLTGKSLDELFPAELRANIEFLSSPKKFERTAYIEHRALEHYAIATRERMVQSQNLEYDRPTSDDLKLALTTALHKLSARQREILEYRFGLNSDTPHTLEETSQFFHLSRERIRQIENRAIRELQRPKNSEELRDFVS